MDLWVVVFQTSLAEPLVMFGHVLDQERIKWDPPTFLYMFWLFYLCWSGIHWKQWLLCYYYTLVVFPKIHGADSPAWRTTYFRDIKKLERDVWMLLPSWHEAQDGSGQEAGPRPPLLYCPFSRFAAVQVKTAWLLLPSRKPLLGTRASITRQLDSSWGCTVVKNVDGRTSCSTSGLWSAFVMLAQKPALSWNQSAASQKVKVPGLLSAVGMFKTG